MELNGSWSSPIAYGYNWLEIKPSLVITASKVAMDGRLTLSLGVKDVFRSGGEMTMRIPGDENVICDQYIYSCYRNFFLSAKYNIGSSVQNKRKGSVISDTSRFGYYDNIFK